MLTRHFSPALKAAIDLHPVISFDVFDTLLVRRVAEPHDVFRIAATSFEQVLSDHPDLADRRIAAEKKARQEAKGEDVTFAEIYGTDSLLPEGMSREEMNVERSVLCANPAMKPVFDYCRETGRRIFIVSDMYLPKHFIEEILKREGYDGWEGLYVSCEEGLTKASGNLFRKVIADNHLKPEEILHVGDNPWSDGRKALECGIRSFLCEKPLDSLFRRDPRARRAFDEDKSLATHLMLGLISTRLQSPEPIGRFVNCERDLKNEERRDVEPAGPDMIDEADYWFDFGYAFGGPVVAGFTEWIAGRAKAAGVDGVLFVGRDGYVLVKLFEKFCPDIPCRYIYAPRGVQAACAAGEALDSDESRFTENDLTTLVGMFIARGWLPKNWQPPVIENDSERRRFLRNGIQRVRERVVTVVEEYREYLKGLRLDVHAGKAAVVDSCSINLSSQKLLARFLSDTELIGLYWVIPSGHNPADLERHACETFQPEKRHEILNWNLMEWIMTAPHPGVSFITKGQVHFNAAHPNEAERNRIFPLMEKGMLAFADDWRKTFPLPLLSDAMPLVHWINRFCAMPTSIDRKHFSRIKHAPDAAGRQWEDCMQTWTSSDAGAGHLVRRIQRGENTFWLLGSVPLARVKNRADRKRWYVCGIPVLERRADIEGFTFRLFRLIPVMTLKRID